MHVHSHTLAVFWMTKAGSVTTSTWRDRASGEGSLRPERLVLQWGEGSVGFINACVEVKRGKKKGE